MTKLIVMYILILYVWCANDTFATCLMEFDSECDAYAWGKALQEREIRSDCLAPNDVVRGYNVITAPPEEVE